MLSPVAGLRVLCASQICDEQVLGPDLSGRTAPLSRPSRLHFEAKDFERSHSKEQPITSLNFFLNQKLS